MYEWNADRQAAITGKKNLQAHKSLWMKNCKDIKIVNAAIPWKYEQGIKSNSGNNNTTTVYVYYSVSTGSSSNNNNKQ